MGRSAKMTATNGAVVPKMAQKHPLDQLSGDEVHIARQAVLDARKASILFRNIFTAEPAKAELVKFLAAEHAGSLSAETPRPPRQARVQYDVVFEDRSHEYMESIIDIASGKEVDLRRVDKTSQQSLTVDEFQEFNAVCFESEIFKKAIKELNLDEKFEVAIDPWPYGGPDPGEVTPRYYKGIPKMGIRIFEALTTTFPGTHKGFALQNCETATLIAITMDFLFRLSLSWTHIKRKSFELIVSPLVAQRTVWSTEPLRKMFWSTANRLNTCRSC